MRLTRIAPAAVVLVMALTGCADAVPVPTAAATAANSPTPDETILTRPRQVFDGDCSRLFTTDELAAATGVVDGARLEAYTPNAGGFGALTPKGAAITQAGGITCVWSPPAPQSKGAAPLSVYMVITPALADPLIPQPSCDTNPFSGADCEFSIAASGYYATVRLSRDDAGVTVAQITAAGAKIADLFAVKAAEAGPPPTSDVVPGTWSAESTDCDVLMRDPAVIAAVNDDSLHGGWTDDSTGAAGTGDTGYAACWWVDGPRMLSVAMLPGGAWIEDELMAQPGAARLDSGDFANAMTLGGNVHIFSGPNWFFIEGYDIAISDEKTAHAAAAAIISKLDAS